MIYITADRITFLVTPPLLQLFLVVVLKIRGIDLGGAAFRPVKNEWMLEGGGLFSIPRSNEYLFD